MRLPPVRDERGVCYKPPLQIHRGGRESALRKNAEIAVYHMNTDCSASGEEARELRELGYVEGKEVWMRTGLPVEGKRALGSPCTRR